MARERDKRTERSGLAERAFDFWRALRNERLTFGFWLAFVACVSWLAFRGLRFGLAFRLGGSRSHSGTCYSNASSSITMAKRLANRRKGNRFTACFEYAVHLRTVAGAYSLTGAHLGR